MQNRTLLDQRAGRERRTLLYGVGMITKILTLLVGTAVVYSVVRAMTSESGGSLDPEDLR